MSTAAFGLGPEILLTLGDICLLMVVDEDRLAVEDGEEDLGVDNSEFEEL